MGRKLIEAKKCSVCGKGLRHWNKSGLCSYHQAKEHQKEPEVIEQTKEAQKRYYQKNRERILERHKLLRDLKKSEEE